MAYGHELAMIAQEAQRREESIQRLAFCFDVYLDFTENGREETEYMNATKATAQLHEAICAVIGWPSRVMDCAPFDVDHASCRGE